jgi:phosphotransferase system  glucose/maltose/N-acetylglucosamine-specific IIC component
MLGLQNFCFLKYFLIINFFLKKKKKKKEEKEKEEEKTKQKQINSILN